MNWFSLLIAYGICFGIQNKVPWFRALHPFLEAMVKCTYCLGTHCGWMVWLLAWAATGHMPSIGTSEPVGYPAIAATVVAWSMASAAFCYAVDALVQWAETRSA